jgi:hypothetical protein
MCALGTTQKRQEQLVGRVFALDAKLTEYDKVKITDELCALGACYAGSFPSELCCSYNYWSPREWYEYMIAAGSDASGQPAYVTEPPTDTCTCSQLLEALDEAGSSIDHTNSQSLVNGFVEATERVCRMRLSLPEGQRLAQACGLVNEFNAALTFNPMDGVHQGVGLLGGAKGISGPGPGTGTGVGPGGGSGTTPGGTNFVSPK